MKTLLVLVATCALVLRAGLTVREALRPALGTLRALRSGDVEERRRAAQQLMELGPGDARGAIPALIAATGDADSIVRRDATDILGRTLLLAAAEPGAAGEVRDGVAALARATDDPDELDRLAAAYALAECLDHHVGDPALVAAALARAAVRDRAGAVAELAANRLLKLAERTRITPPAELGAALADPGTPGDRRGVAALLLAAFPAGRAAALDPLARALGDPDLLVRRGAAAGLALFDRGAARAALPALLAVAAEPPAAADRLPRAGLRIVAPRGYKPIEHRAAEPPGRSYGPTPAELRDPAAPAALALGTAAAGSDTAPAAAVAALARMLDADRPWRRAGAASGLRVLGPRAAPAAPALVAALGRAGADYERPNLGGSPIPPDLIEAVANVAPGTPEAPAAVAALARLLHEPAVWTHSEAVIPALGRFGPEAAPALPRLRALAAQSAPFFARPIAAAIGSIETTAATPPGRPQPQEPRR